MLLGCPSSSPPGLCVACFHVSEALAWLPAIQGQVASPRRCCVWFDSSFDWSLPYHYWLRICWQLHSWSPYVVLSEQHNESFLSYNNVTKLYLQFYLFLYPCKIWSVLISYTLSEVVCFESIFSAKWNMLVTSFPILWLCAHYAHKVHTLGAHHAHQVHTLCYKAMGKI